MAEMELVKTQKGIRGFGDDNDRAWRRFKRWLKGLGAGEVFSVSYRKRRNGKFHRKFFAMLKYAFDVWDPALGRKRLTYKGMPIAKNFDAFRKDILILAGFGVPHFDLKGRVHWEAKSISYAAMDDDEEFEKVYNAVLDVLLEHVLINFKTREDVERVVAELERFG